MVGGIPECELTPEEKRQMAHTKVEETEDIDAEADGFFGDDEEEE